MPTLAEEDSTLPARYAGFWIRLAASLIDLPFVLLLVSLEVVIVALPLGLLSLAIPELSTRLAHAAGILLLFVGPLPYFVGLESSPWQGTVGKRLLRLRVVDTSMEPLSLSLACRRYLTKWLSLYPSGAGFLLTVLRENKQAFHDSVNGTLVVRAFQGRRTRDAQTGPAPVA